MERTFSGDLHAHGIANAQSIAPRNPLRHIKPPRAQSIAPSAPPCAPRNRLRPIKPPPRNPLRLAQWIAPHTPRSPTQFLFASIAQQSIEPFLRKKPRFRLRISLVH